MNSKTLFTKLAVGILIGQIEQMSKVRHKGADFITPAIVHWQGADNTALCIKIEYLG